MINKPDFAAMFKSMVWKVFDDEVVGRKPRKVGDLFRARLIVNGVTSVVRYRTTEIHIGSKSIYYGTRAD